MPNTSHKSLETPLYKGFLLKNVRDERFCSKRNNWEHNGESEEEFIDLKPIFDDLYIDSATFLIPIKRVPTLSIHAIYGLINSKKQANITLIVVFSLSLHPNYTFEMYARRKSPEISAGRTKEGQPEAYFNKRKR